MRGPKGMCAKKFCGVQQKSSLKPPLQGVDNPISANFLLKSLSLLNYLIFNTSIYFYLTFYKNCGVFMASCSFDLLIQIPEFLVTTTCFFNDVLMI